MAARLYGGAGGVREVESAAFTPFGFRLRTSRHPPLREGSAMNSPLPQSHRATCLRRRFALLQLGALLGLAFMHTACTAIAPAPQFSMQLVDRDSGVALSQYASRGRSYSPGTPGARYAI